MSPELTEYLNGAFDRIEGWCHRQVWSMVAPVIDFQNENSIHRPVAEIGVFHGKFLIGLIKAKNTSCNYAIDVFDMQQFNLDQAGPGNLSILKKNLADCGVSEGDVKLLREDSMSLQESDIDTVLECSRGFSLFSVDGCHLPEHTVNDIKVAMRLTVPQGLIFVDDYYNSHWPGVQDGVCKLYFSEYPKFVPLAFGYNKLVLCHLSFHQNLLGRLIAGLRADKMPFKQVKRFGYDSLSVN